MLFRIDLFIKWSCAWPEPQLRQGFLLSVSVSDSVSVSISAWALAEFSLSQQFVRLVCRQARGLPAALAIAKRRGEHVVAMFK